MRGSIRQGQGRKGGVGGEWGIIRQVRDRGRSALGGREGGTSTIHWQKG